MESSRLVDYAPEEVWGETFPFEWCMTRSERMALLHLLRRFRPQVAIEVGTFEGGSLQALSRYADTVYTLDIEPKGELATVFRNTRFVTGDSRETLPLLVSKVNDVGEPVGLVLIDGDHSESAVRRDVESALDLLPQRDVALVVHDSFNPRCRAGLLGVRWDRCPWLHYVEVDFVPGVFLPGRPTAEDSMYGGFALALLRPTRRSGAIEIFESQREAFEICRRFARLSGFLATRRSLSARVLHRLVRLFGRLRGA